tara:strand:+ start:3862 stop:4077 length:216 start_codon:yes stop_codon:yes gene_type:complete
MEPMNSDWTPTEEENNGIITKTYESIKLKLDHLKEETDCPDEFIFRFLGAIQQEWHPSSCHSIARTSKKDF